MTEESIHWRHLLSMRSQMRSLAIGIAALIALDFVISMIYGFLLPDTQLLSNYLYDDYPEVIEEFMNGDMAVIPDETAGWINAPSYEIANWKTDALGSRVGSATDDADDGRLVMLLGSSTMNGGMHVSGDETISAYLEDAGYRAMNFGTMMYSVDQSLLDFKKRLSHLKPDVLVVGIHSEAEAVSNLFVPFRIRQERKMPFLKPAFAVSDIGLLKKQFPTSSQGDPDQRQAMLDYLREQDPMYFSFDTYRTMGLLPISNQIRRTYIKVKRQLLDADEFRSNLEIQKRLIQRFADWTDANSTQLIVLKFAPVDTYRPSPLKEWLLPDYNGEHDRMLADTSATVLNVIRILEKTDVPISNFFHRDGEHLTAKGNRVIAEVLTQVIRSPAHRIGSL